ncbi:MAG: hypothetical protein WAT23_00570, partial [Chromatiaceae bacterium]
LGPLRGGPGGTHVVGVLGAQVRQQGQNGCEGALGRLGVAFWWRPSGDTGRDAPLPLGLIGAFPAHWLLGTTLLGGLHGRRHRPGGRGHPQLALMTPSLPKTACAPVRGVDDALLEAGAVRLRPMLLTSLAIALGTWIMVPNPVFGGLAIALIFGAMSSVVFSLFLVPLLYWRLLASSGGVAR